MNVSFINFKVGPSTVMESMELKLTLDMFWCNLSNRNQKFSDVVM